MSFQPQQNLTHPRIFVEWKIPEYDKHERTRAWYVGASIVGIALVAYALFTSNFLFAIILIIGAIVIVLNDGREPDMIDFAITTEGVIVGRKFYNFNELKDFSIVYKPREGVKNLYFEFNNPIKHRLSIPLLDMNPLPIRDFLLKYLSEDLERTDEPTSEMIGRVFKI